DDRQDRLVRSPPQLPKSRRVLLRGRLSQLPEGCRPVALLRDHPPEGHRLLDPVGVAHGGTQPRERPSVDWSRLTPLSGSPNDPEHRLKRGIWHEATAVIHNHLYSLDVASCQV